MLVQKWGYRFVSVSVDWPRCDPSFFATTGNSVYTCVRYFVLLNVISVSDSDFRFSEDSLKSQWLEHIFAKPRPLNISSFCSAWTIVHCFVMCCSNVLLLLYAELKWNVYYCTLEALIILQHLQTFAFRRGQTENSCSTVYSRATDNWDGNDRKI